MCVLNIQMDYINDRRTVEAGRLKEEVLKFRNVACSEISYEIGVERRKVNT